MAEIAERAQMNRVVFAVLALITVGLFVMAGYLFWIDQRVFLTGEQGQAVVISKQKLGGTNRTGTQSVSYIVRYRFTPENSSMIYSKQPVSRGLFDEVEVSDEIPVWYDPANPDTSYVDRIARWNALICLMIALAFAGGLYYCVRFDRAAASR